MLPTNAVRFGLVLAALGGLLFTLDLPLLRMAGNDKGTLIFVSHDRQFVSSLATQILEIKGDGGYNYYVGGYEDYLHSQGVE